MSTFAGCAGWAVIPLRVRIVVIVSRGVEGTDELPRLEAEFDEVRAWWLRVAAIELQLVSGFEIVVAEDLRRNADWRDPVDSLHVAGSDWVTVVYTDGVTHAYTMSSGGFDYSQKFGGFAFFARPDRDQFGYGAVIDINESTWGVFAHEIGHLLGLPHSHTSQDDLIDSLDGEWLGGTSLAPFGDDTLSLTFNEVKRNLMCQNGTTVKGLHSDEATLTYSQALRARLTVVSRTCPFGTLFDTAPNYQGSLPVMTAIETPFLRQIFGSR